MPEQTHEKDILQRLQLKIKPLVTELKFYFDGKQLFVKIVTLWYLILKS